jgi:hypothetical protein
MLGSSGWTDPPPPAAEMLAAVRRHLTMRYARGVPALVWELEKRPMPDTEAVRAVLAAASAGEPAEALDLGGALVLVQAIRLSLDALEADVLDAALAGGLSAESAAAVLELPSADALDARHQLLRARRTQSGSAAGPDPRASAGVLSREAAQRAGRRATRARQRADEIGRRRDERAGGRGRPAAAVTAAAQRAAQNTAERAAQAAASAGEARVSAIEAGERVALGLLRAADVLELCAARCESWSGPDQAEQRQRAVRLLGDAAAYREMASRYRDESGQPG